VLLVAFDAGTTAAGVFTQKPLLRRAGRSCAASISRARQRPRAGRQRGQRQRRDRRRRDRRRRSTCAAVASMLECAPREVLPFSTGVIMEPLPVDKIVAALPGPSRRSLRDHWFGRCRPS
jgi:glutamate N-acetyltransferase/amino-acid N-acetyltransferase